MEEIWEVVELWQRECSDAMGRPYQTDIGFHGNVTSHSLSADDISDISCVTSTSSRHEGLDMSGSYDKFDSHDTIGINTSSNQDSTRSNQDNTSSNQVGITDINDDNITENNNNTNVRNHDNRTGETLDQVTDAVINHITDTSSTFDNLVGNTCPDNVSDKNIDNSQELLLQWDNIGSPDENKTWTKMNKTDMRMAYLPGKMMLSVRGDSTSEEML
jgi:hypothetical protein